VALASRRKSLLPAVQLAEQGNQRKNRNQKRNRLLVVQRVVQESNLLKGKVFPFAPTSLVATPSAGDTPATPLFFRRNLWQISISPFNGILQMNVTSGASTATSLQKDTLLLFQ